MISLDRRCALSRAGSDGAAFDDERKEVALTMTSRTIRLQRDKTQKSWPVLARVRLTPDSRHVDPLETSRYASLRPARASRKDEEEKTESRQGEKTETSETADLIRNEIPGDDPFK